MSVERELATLHTKVDSILDILKENQEPRIKTLEKQDGTLRRWQAAVSGVALTIGACLKALWDKIPSIGA